MSSTTWRSRPTTTRRLVRSDRARLLASSSITALATIDVVVPTVDDVGLEAIVVNDHRGSIEQPVLDGRRPGAPDEVALTPKSVALLDKGIGDRLELGGPSRTRSFVITGVVAVPFVAPSANGEQLLLTPAGRDALGLEPTAFALVMDVRDSEAVDAVRAPNDDIHACTSKLLPILGVERLPGARATGIVPCSPRLDPRAANLRELGAVPTLVTAFLVVLGVAGLAFLLGGSVRRTGHDLAVLRALGFTRRQVGTAALVQGAAVTVVGAVLALPLGIALGRWIWRLTIADLGLVEHIVVPGAVLAGVALLAVAVGLVVSSIPAARDRPWVRGERAAGGVARRRARLASAPCASASASSPSTRGRRAATSGGGRRSSASRTRGPTTTSRGGRCATRRGTRRCPRSRPRPSSRSACASARWSRRRTSATRSRSRASSSPSTTCRPAASRSGSVPAASATTPRCSGRTRGRRGSGPTASPSSSRCSTACCASRRCPSTACTTRQSRRAATPAASRCRASRSRSRRWGRGGCAWPRPTATPG